MGWRQGRWWWRFGATLGRTLAGWPTIPPSGLCFVRVGCARLHRSLGSAQGGLQQFRQLSLFLTSSKLEGTEGPIGRRSARRLSPCVSRG